MATERLSMRKTREILRQKWELGRTHRDIAESVGASLGAVAVTLSRAKSAGLDWTAAQALGDDALEERIYGVRSSPLTRMLPDFEYLHAERKKPGVTLQLLHLEYLEKFPGGFRYTAFCDRYREWLNRRGLTMRQEHFAGEKLFIDYAGKKPHIVNPTTGEVIDVELFVAVLGASNYTYAEATLTQRGPDFIASNVRALAFIGGVPAALVPDQLKSAVTVASRYEPGINRTYEDLALHYGTTVVPARPRRPRDKAKVEVAVQIAERWIVARLRHETFFSLDALNERIAELLVELNERKMRRYGASRRELFERLDRPALKPLPVEPFTYCEWMKGRLNIDYHVEVDHHFYSAPHQLVHEVLEARATATTVELLHRGERVASHVRSYVRGRHSTLTEHMPKAHQKHLEWSPTRIIGWGANIGPKTRELVEAILAERRHPEQGYRSCLGILRLGKRFGHDRLEAAAARAVAVRARSYRHVELILKNGLDRMPSAVESDASEGTTTPIVHENIRGGGYYQ
jgi:transposase